MAIVLDVVTHKNVDGSSKDVVVLRDTSNNRNFTVGALSLADGNPVDDTHGLPVKIVADAAGTSALDGDVETFTQSSAVKLALAAAVLFGADGVTPSSAARLIGYIFSGAQAVSEVGTKGAATTTTVTVDATTANGVQLIAANGGGLRRRVIITQRGTTPVEVAPGNITAASGVGRYLPGVPGAEQTWFIQGALRATVASGTQVVSVSTEILA